MLGSANPRVDSKRVPLLLVGMAALTAAMSASATHVCTNSPDEVFVGLSPPSNGVAAMPLCRWVTPQAPATPERRSSFGISDNHGAVVRHKDAGAPWLASGYPSYRTARRAAMDACEEAMGRGCDVALEVKDTIAVIAVRDDGEYVAAGAPSEAKARDEALQRCRDGGRQCETVFVLHAKYEFTHVGSAPNFKPRVENLNE